ncbi:MAG: hypothetical protein QG670_1384, partial [Thermoproteota archaeon]|nr:hypothetical protein [Thermoproteota archaeon]
MRILYVELLPYAMLGYLSHTFSSSWLVNVERRAGSTTISPIKRDQKVILSEQIPSPPKSSVLSQLSVSFEVFKSMFFRLTLPIKTEVKLGFDKNKSSLSFINNDAFRFDFTFIGGDWFRGFSVPISAYGVLDRFDDQICLHKRNGYYHAKL